MRSPGALETPGRFPSPGARTRAFTQRVHRAAFRVASRAVSDSVTTDWLLEFRNGVVAEVERRRAAGEFLRLLQDNRPNHPLLSEMSVFSEASHGESLTAVDSRNLIIREVETRRAAVVVSNRKLLTATDKARLGLPDKALSKLVHEMQRQLQPKPPEPPSEADPDQNPMWGESAAAPHHDCVASRTFVRRTDHDGIFVVQDRLTAIVAIPVLRVAVFAALVWERIIASN